MSNTIKQAISALKSRIADAYTAIQTKGGTLPATQDSANLSAAIASIPSGGRKVYFTNPPSTLIGLFQNSTREELGEDLLDFNGYIYGTYSTQNMFRDCANVKRIDLSKANVTLGGWFPAWLYGDSNLEELYMNGSCNVDNSTINWGVAFYGCSKLKILRVGSWFTKAVSFDISNTAMQRDNLVQLFTDIGTQDGSSGNTLVIGATKLSLLSATDIAIATDKGWILQ